MEGLETPVAVDSFHTAIWQYVRLQGTMRAHGPSMRMPL